MNAWPFVIAAYALTIVGTFGLAVWSWRAMRAAESFADRVKRRP